MATIRSQVDEEIDAVYEISDAERQVIVARQLGHDPWLTLSIYGHVIDELEDLPRIDAETAIAEARTTLAGEGPATETSTRA